MIKVLAINVADKKLQSGISDVITIYAMPGKKVGFVVIRYSLAIWVSCNDCMYRHAKAITEANTGCSFGRKVTNN